MKLKQEVEYIAEMAGNLKKMIWLKRSKTLGLFLSPLLMQLLHVLAKLLMAKKLTSSL